VNSWVKKQVGWFTKFGMTQHVELWKNIGKFQEWMLIIFIFNEQLKVENNKKYSFASIY